MNKESRNSVKFRYPWQHKQNRKKWLKTSTTPRLRLEEDLPLLHCSHCHCCKWAKTQTELNNVSSGCFEHTILKPLNRRLRLKKYIPCKTANTSITCWTGCQNDRINLREHDYKMFTSIHSTGEPDRILALFSILTFVHQ